MRGSSGSRNIALKNDLPAGAVHKFALDTVSDNSTLHYRRGSQHLPSLSIQIGVVESPWTLKTLSTVSGHCVFAYWYLQRMEGTEPARTAVSTGVRFWSKDPVDDTAWASWP